MNYYGENYLKMSILNDLVMEKLVEEVTPDLPFCFACNASGALAPGAFCFVVFP